MAQETVVKRKPPVSELTTPSADDGYTQGIGMPRETLFAEAIGVFQDDPMLDAMMENIHRRRRELNADATVE